MSFKHDLNGVLELIRLCRGAENSYNVIRNALPHNMPLPGLDTAANRLFYRTRPHLKGEKFFNRIEDLSYRRDVMDIMNFGKANKPNQPIFYCADDALVAFTETSTVVRENVDKDVEVYTTGIWKPIGPLPIAHLIVKRLPHDAFSNNDFIKRSLSNFNEQIKQGLFDPKWIDILAYFLGEFMTTAYDGGQYETTAAFANYVYDYVGANHERLAGMVYPSALCPNRGINFAIKPEFAGGSHLKLVGAQKCISRRINNVRIEMYATTEVINCKAINHDKGEIIWE